MAGCVVGVCTCPHTPWAGEGLCSAPIHNGPRLSAFRRNPTRSAAAEVSLSGQRGGRTFVRGLRGWLRRRDLRLPRYFLGWEGLRSAPVHNGPRLSAFRRNPTTSAAAEDFARTKRWPHLSARTAWLVASSGFALAHVLSGLAEVCAVLPSTTAHVSQPLHETQQRARRRAPTNCSTTNLYASAYVRASQTCTRRPDLNNGG